MSYIERFDQTLKEARLEKENAALKAEVARLNGMVDDLRRCASVDQCWESWRAEALKYKAEVARLTEELAIHKGDGKHDHNFTYTAERESLRKEVARLNDMLRSEKQDRIKAEFEVARLTKYMNHLEEFIADVGHTTFDDMVDPDSDLGKEHAALCKEGD